MTSRLTVGAGLGVASAVLLTKTVKSQSAKPARDIWYNASHPLITPPDEDQISGVPEEILAQVTSYLSDGDLRNIALVSRRFNVSARFGQEERMVKKRKRGICFLHGHEKEIASKR